VRASKITVFDIGSFYFVAPLYARTRIFVLEPVTTSYWVLVMATACRQYDLVQSQDLAGLLLVVFSSNRNACYYYSRYRNY
jgi:hypothetical protein